MKMRSLGELWHIHISNNQFQNLNLLILKPQERDYYELYMWWLGGCLFLKYSANLLGFRHTKVIKTERNVPLWDLLHVCGLIMFAFCPSSPFRSLVFFLGLFKCGNSKEFPLGGSRVLYNETTSLFINRAFYSKNLNTCNNHYLKLYFKIIF